MKALVPLLLLSSITLAQEPSKTSVITFSRTDTEHCRVILVEGKPMLQSTYGGTVVAVTLPERNSHGFSVFVRISRQAKGKIEVVPERFTAIYSDPDHTRFEFVDMHREWEKSQKSERTATSVPNFNGIASASSQNDNHVPASPPVETARATMPDGSVWVNRVTPQDGASRWSEEGGKPVSSPTNHPRSPFLTRMVLHEGNQVEGIVVVGSNSTSKVELPPALMLAEIDLPIGDVVFRF
jgi:hypothetical protein